MKSTCLFFLCGAVLMAQQGTPTVIEDHHQTIVTGGPIGAGNAAFVSAGPGMEMKWFAEDLASDHHVVSGAPYSASSVTETVQTLADGNHIRHTTTSSVARDSQGRTRREQSMAGLASLAAGAPPLPTMVFIQDPVAKTHYVLEPDTKIARTTPAGPPALASMAPPPGTYQMRFVQKDNAAMPAIKKESLGSQTVNGVQADGTRITRTIAAGEMGNEKPIEIVTETWYSPDLQATVRSKSSDPRMGDTTFELQNIDRSEPAPSLFAVPADYTVQESRGPISITTRSVQAHE